MLQIDWVVHRQAQMRLDHNWTGLKSIITKPKVFHLFVWGVTRSSYVCRMVLGASLCPNSSSSVRDE